MADNSAYDGDDNFLGGQDASKGPDTVARNGYYAGINVTTEKGSLSPRWGFRKIKLDWVNAGKFRLPNFNFKTYQELFESGRFQALIPYSIGTTYYLIVIVSGVIFLINQRTYEVRVIPIEDGSLINENTPRITWSEATKYLIVYDYPNLPVIIQGIGARRSNRAKHEVPVATLGAYNSNRLFVVNGGNEFTAGDPAGLRGVSDANPPISFLEIETEGSDYFAQSFQVSTNYNNDKITAMAFLQNADSSTGIGPLLLGTKRAIWSYMAQNPRSQWQQSQFGSIFVYNSGIVGPRALTHTGSDMFFMGADGEVRTLSMSRDEQAKWSKTSMSREIKNWLKFWDPNLKDYSVLGYFKNKIFVSVNPYRVQATSIIGKPITDFAHGGMAVLEVDNVSNLRAQSTPVWAGLWTGVRPMDFCNSDEKFFIMSKDDDTRNHLYEMMPDKTYDIVDDAVRYVRARIYTRDYDFQLPMADKSLGNLEFNMKHMLGPIKVSIKYKPSHGAVYANWRQEWTHDAPWQTNNVPTPEQLNGFSGHSFKRLNFGSPEDSSASDPVTEDSYEAVRNVRLKIDITGKYWELKQIILTATPIQQSSLESVAENQFKPLALPVELDDDWAIIGEDKCLTT